MNYLKWIPILYLSIPILSIGLRNFISKIGLPIFGAAFLLSTFSFLSPEIHHQTFEIQWFKSGHYEFNIQLVSDTYSSITLAFASLIGFLVYFYSLSYFKGTGHITRYFNTISFFMASMSGLILSGNVLFTFFCWELVGICSYLLIGFYREEVHAGQAATKALVINKIGDIGFLIALLTIWITFQSFKIEIIENTYTEAGANALLLIGFSLLLAIVAKSAQFPLHTWLPDAMAGPSPVSALIHSATMVAAGVYLLVKWHFLFPLSVLNTAGVLGLLTALIGGWNALFQVKLKQLLAWSTISQLGLMVMTAGWGNESSALMHLISHGFFKAGLFLAAGWILMQIPEQSENELKECAKFTAGDRWISGSLLIFSLSLSGIPFTASFLSKECMVAGLPEYALIPFYFITALSIAYTARLIWYLKPTRLQHSFSKLNGINFPILVLAIFCGWWIWSSEPFNNIGYLKWSDRASWSITIASSLISVLLLIIFFQIIKKGRWNNLHQVKAQIKFDYGYEIIVIKPFMWFVTKVSLIDRNILDRFVHAFGYIPVMFAHLSAAFDRYWVNGLYTWLASLFGLAGQLIRKISQGNIQTYLWWSVTTLIILLIWQS